MYFIKKNLINWFGIHNKIVDVDVIDIMIW